MSESDERTIADIDGGLTLAVERFLCEGQSADLIVGQDRRDGKRWVAKSGRYPGTVDPAVIAEQAKTEAAAIRAAGPRGAGPALVVHVRTPEAETDAGPAPVVAYPFVDGEPLDGWLLTAHPDGAPVDVALAVVRDIADALSFLHEAGFVHRCVSPEHVIIEADGRAKLIGLGNAVRRGSPPRPHETWFDERYSAPEIETEESGRFNGPRADVYGLGLLLARCVTGEHPTGEPGTPLTRLAVARLQQLPEGVALLIARCSHPLHKYRFASVSRLLPHLSPETLPTPDTDGFGDIRLIAPWATWAASDLPVGHLSPGPLVDRPARPAPASEDPDSRTTATARPRRSEMRGLVLAASLAALGTALWVAVRHVLDASAR